MKDRPYKSKRIKIITATEDGDAIINENAADQNADDKPETNADREIREALESSSLLKEKKQKQKKMFKWSGYAAGAGLVGYIIYWLFAPISGGIWYSLCKTYLELNVRYPQYLTYSTVDWFDDSIRIWFTQLDGFGQFRMEPIQCFFKEDQTMGYAISRITISRREVDPQKVEAFNKSSYVFLSFPPNDNMPAPLPDSLEGLQFETDKFRIQF
jgi:hypothetical protein